MLVTILAAIGSVVLHASQRSHGTRTNTSGVLFGLGTVTAALVVYRVLIDLPQASRVIDQKLGAFLGVVCALGIALGGMEAVAQQRTGARSGPLGTDRGTQDRGARHRSTPSEEEASPMTDFKPSRLRSGEWLAGGAAVVLLVAMVFAPWYGLQGIQATFAKQAGQSTTITGWDEFIHLRWLILLTIVFALALVARAGRLSGARDPVTLGVPALLLGIATSVWLIYRVLILCRGRAPGRPSA